MSRNQHVEYACREKANPDPTAGGQARYIHPILPESVFFTALTQPDRFPDYTLNEFPTLSVNPLTTTKTSDASGEPSSPNDDVSALNPPDNLSVPIIPGSITWISKALFPDSSLPVPFNEDWDEAPHKLLDFPLESTAEAIQGWLNSLSQSLALSHNLNLQNETSSEESNVYPMATPIDQTPAIKRANRLFSLVGHGQDPSINCFCESDIVLLDRTVQQFLSTGDYRSRSQHIQAIVEVSSSASKEEMFEKILKKSSLMFRTQPFRRFAVSLAFNGSSENIEFCFLLVDRAGVVMTPWYAIAGYEAVHLARIIFALSYAPPEVIGVDISAVIDILSGNILQITVDGQVFRVVKEMHSSPVLFDSGTRVFLVTDENGGFHILKDSWVLVTSGTSEIKTLSHISATMKKDPVGAKYVHPQFIAGEASRDSTNRRRGKLANKPPERVNCRVVTGPIGDPITSFRSRAEFVQVLFDAVEWLEWLHTKCNIFHGNININNVVIYRAPPAFPPGLSPPSSPAKKKGKNQKGTTSIQPTPIQPAPEEGVRDLIPVTGAIMDYSHASDVGAVLNNSSETLPFVPLTALDPRRHGSYQRDPGDDLEALLYTAIAVVTFTVGPCGEMQNWDIYIPIARWYNESDREQLRKDKAIDILFFEDEIAAYLSEYWKPFAPYLRRLIDATWPTRDIAAKNSASCATYKRILGEALEHFKDSLQESVYNYATVKSRRY